MASGKIKAHQSYELPRSTQWYLCAGTPPGGGPAGWLAVVCSWTSYWPSWHQKQNGPPQSSRPLHPVAGPGTRRGVARSLEGPGVERGIIGRVGTTLGGLEGLLTLCLNFPTSKSKLWASLSSRILEDSAGGGGV